MQNENKTGAPGNRALIMEQAMRLFSDRGYDAVGVQEICTGAGITKPTLYHYFGSKRGLLDAILAEYSIALFGAIVPAAKYTGDVTMTLRNITFAYLNFAGQNKAFYRMQLSMWLSPPESEPFNAVLPLLNRQHTMMEEVFISAARNHGNMKGRHAVYAATFLGMINTYIGFLLGDIMKVERELVYKIVHQFMHGIFS